MAQQPNLDRLKSQLLTSGLQERNNALYQVINQLIDNLRQSVDNTQAQITAIISGTAGATGPRGPQGLQGFPGLDGSSGFDEGLDPILIGPALPTTFYEKGLWTPTIVSAGGGTPTYTTQYGSFVRIGEFIQAIFLVTLSGFGTLAAGNITINGLPYLVNNNPIAGTPQYAVFANLATAFTSVYCAPNPATHSSLIRGVIAATTTNVTSLTVADLNATSTLAGSAIYTRD